MRRPVGKSLVWGVLIFFAAEAPLFGHIADEISVKTTVDFNEEDIRFSFDISSGVLFSTAFLKILDPDRNKIFEADHIRAFSDFFLDTLEIQSGGGKKVPVLKNFTASEWDFFAAGISTIILEYALEGEEGETSGLKYEISFYPETAVYSLHIKNNVPGKVAILKEKRNEYLQDVLELQYTRDPEQIAAFKPPVPAPVLPAGAEGNASADNDARDVPGNLFRNGFEVFGIMLFLRDQSGNTLLGIMLILAVAVGFLHAFTPGHGKALVGAFLIANRGTAFHALCLGLVITLTHTASVYGFGFLASAAAWFFLPGEFIPVLTFLCGIFITGLGIQLFVKRLLGTGTDHAHLVPNLRLLKRETVNILIDGAAAEANEALLIASDEEELQESLKAAGAENFNLCSPGCSTHTRLPPLIRERQHSEFFKLAIKTGAVDGVVTASDRTIKHLGRLRSRTWVERYDAAAARPREFLSRALGNYASRGTITMPEEKLSWGRVITLGISGGILPCPDALAVLLAAIAAGKIAEGMGIILFFSMGLAFALILVGMVIVFTKRILTGQKGLASIAAYIPYVSSLVITVLGILMVTGIVSQFQNRLF
ncbi:MAG: sulfite exporter TauE/SafE family protein [Treponema sp.]|jgi:ABC-type nickel/cobalt efflux system permease component RcnA|nr:sulfite exporter TauE/SafE family protein [Treponema sp.]